MSTQQVGSAVGSLIQRFQVRIHDNFQQEGPWALTFEHQGTDLPSSQLKALSCIQLQFYNALKFNIKTAYSCFILILNLNKCIFKLIHLFDEKWKKI